MRAACAITACIALALSGCGGSSGRKTKEAAATPPSASTHPKPPAGPPQVLGATAGSNPTGFVPAVRWRGQTAVWIARSASGLTLLSFDQQLVHLALHSGTVDAGGSGWRWGPAPGRRERTALVAAFNGGFKFDTGAGGFMSGGRTAVALRPGLASIVVHADGRTEIGSWHREVPTGGSPIVSVRQNLTLLVDHGRPAASTDCLSCWGATLGGVSDPARSALGITADGHLIWAGAEHLTVQQLADALVAARVVHAVELDINPEWVAAYVYRHAARGLKPMPLVRDQLGTPGAFLAPYSRDFFTVLVG
jgi:hypothetical protein